MKPNKFLNILIYALFLAALAVRPAVSEEGGFRTVTGPCRLSFPSDHGPHPAYRTEWWYYTGNLTDRQKRRFGFQLTFFRNRLQPAQMRKNWPKPASAWRTDQIYLAHAAITDVTGGHHLQAEKTARPVLSMAGAQQKGADVIINIHTWQAVITPHGHRLQADAGDFSLSLDLTPSKPPVMHGDGGYSRKGQSPERASCYYSFTHLQTTGTLNIGGTRHTVQGSAWMDHEFSTAPLQPGIVGWDWFCLQLNDRTELMIYLLRQKDGTLNPASSGTAVMPSGRSRHLQLGDVRVTPLSFWKSPHTGARYPIKWRMRIAPLQLDITLAATLDDQEMRTLGSTRVVYWEGSVEVEGTGNESAVEGVGYIELTGYDKPFDAPL